MGDENVQIETSLDQRNHRKSQRFKVKVNSGWLMGAPAVELTVANDGVSEFSEPSVSVSSIMDLWVMVRLDLQHELGLFLQLLSCKWPICPPWSAEYWC